MRRDYEPGQRRKARRQRKVTRRKQGKTTFPPINPKDSVDNELRPIDHNGYTPDDDGDLCAECSWEQDIKRGMIDAIRELGRIRILLEEHAA